MSTTGELWRAIEPIYAAILAHPFVRGLTDGSLPHEAFRFYAVQDALYLRDFARAPGLRALSDAARARLDRVLPALLDAAAASQQPDPALQRLLPLLQNILRRTSYLALLDEQPAALQRLVDVVARSALLGERLAAYPLLLDELLDARAEHPRMGELLIELGGKDPQQPEQRDPYQREYQRQRQSK